jgi:pyridoxamine 5'-phosphate oxidase
MKEDIGHLRNHYEGELLDEKLVLQDPVSQFKKWFMDALNSNVNEPNAMSLATVNASGIPSLRTVLLKDADSSGFTFYTNYNSRKAKDMKDNPHVSILFFWPELFRQIRIDGVISQIDPAISEAYFKVRPKGHQLSALASEQSKEIKSKYVLEQKYIELEEKYMDQEIPFPTYWGGYCIKPTCFEFWQGQPNRLHDRITYTIDSDNGSWCIKRLAP